jgi:hypothetical protein
MDVVRMVALFTVLGLFATQVFFAYQIQKAYIRIFRRR